MKLHKILLAAIAATNGQGKLKREKSIKKSIKIDHLVIMAFI